ncbi:hypothetical protein F4824DRAFT_415123 [Ustulina deusta]|nr:hypothetical protein F4824DRAFT_415123 [Ustulina deusta]
MSSTTDLPVYQPLYTREILNDIEAELANDGDSIKLQNNSGNTVRSKNTNKGVGLGPRDLAPGCRRPANIVAFQDERDLGRLEARGKADLFFPVYNTTMIFNGPNQTEEETRQAFAQTLQEFESSEEGVAMASLVRTHLKGCTVNKVIAFGLGRIGFLRPGPPQTFYEHAAARVIARAVGEVSSSPNVAVAVQDPLYTDVCKKVLAEFEFDVVEGFGAKGFALVDENTVVLAHHPNFPFRQIIADLARPALICMRAQEPTAAAEPRAAAPELLLLPDMRADVDSARSRRMLAEEYRAVELPVSGQRAFWENTWYIRNNSTIPWRAD